MQVIFLLQATVQTEILYIISPVLVDIIIKLIDLN